MVGSFEVIDHPSTRILFDAKWYARRNGLSSEDAAWQHFSDYGIENRLDPNPLFDSLWYQNTYPEAAAVGALSHFLAAEPAQALCPSPFFDSSWYLAQNADVRNVGVNPYVHFIQWGRNEGCLPNRWCDPAYTGDPSFDIELPSGFSFEDMIGYIPSYTTLKRLVSGAESSAFLYPQIPRWIFVALGEPDESLVEGDYAVLLGGRRELFSRGRAYDPDMAIGLGGGHRAFQVRYAVSPIVRNAVTVLGREIGSAEAMLGLQDEIAATVATRPDLPLAEINIIADAEAAQELRSQFANGPLSMINVVALQRGYLCRVSNLLQSSS